MNDALSRIAAVVGPRGIIADPAEMAPYLCNPTLAHEALQLEDKVGTMLPCNVVVQDAGGGKTEVAAIDPVASMQAIDNPRLRRAAEQVQGKLRKVIASL